MNKLFTWFAVISLACGMVGVTCGDDDNGNPDPEICNNGLDDDGDGLVDCLDGDCNTDPNCQNVCNENGTCDTGENNANCPADCPAVCPNGTCESTEDASSCPEDCGEDGDCTAATDLVAQEGCDASEACDILDSSGTIGCRDEGGTPDYDPCSAATDCLAGASCISLDGVNLFCAPFCDPDTEVCPGTGSCYITLGSVSGVKACGIVTLDNCDLVTYDTCDQGEGCYLADSEGGTVCMTAGTFAPGATCTFANDCQAGYGCVGQDPNYTCTQLCKVQADCDTGTCSGVGQIFTNHADVGYCAP